MDTRDVTVVGAGAFGLWTALACLRLGLSVAVVEARAPGAGASGGVVGALTPHRPTGWNALKAVQLAGLASLEGEAAALREETGIDTGYARPGRVTPLRDEAAREGALADIEAARARWPAGHGIAVHDGPPCGTDGVFAAEAFAHGAVTDTLSARIDPRRLVAALGAAVEARGGEIRRGWSVVRIDPSAGRLEGPAGSLSAGDLVLAAGWETAPFAEALGLAPGSPVKGQAALLAASLPGNAPVFHGRGVFVVRQGAGRVAIGSTSEPGRSDTETDGALDRVIATARSLCPALADAPVAERWAGIRPRPPGRLPVIGPVPRAPGVWMATGGHKIGLAIAHVAGEAIAHGIAGSPPPHPMPDEVVPHDPA